MNKRDFKDKIYSELAKIAKAISNPHRMEIIDLLAQGPFAVEQIAINTGMSIANASQHLQTLKNAKLVTATKDGNFIYYSLSGQRVYASWSALRELGQVYNGEIDKVVNSFRKKLGATDAIDAETLLSKIKNNEVVILDVRPGEEFHRGHIHRAISAPFDQIIERIQHLPKNKLIVAYCRGPFCVYADEAVSLLKKKGYTAQRLSEGYPDWAMKGFPIDNIIA